MSESAPDSPELSTEVDQLSTIISHDKSLADWHKWLTVDQRTGESHGHDAVPCSRYGDNGEECAWYAIACEVVYCEANGENSDDDPKAGLDHYMSLAVNDHDDIATLLHEYDYTIPSALREKLGTRLDIFNMLSPSYFEQLEGGSRLTFEQHQALGRLCLGFGVGYKPTDYYVYPADSWMMPGWCEGWLGGMRHANPEYATPDEPRGASTLYVGVSPDGEAHS